MGLIATALLGIAGSFVFLGSRYDVVAARDGIEGLEQAAKFRPDLVIADLAMLRAAQPCVRSATRLLR